MPRERAVSEVKEPHLISLKVLRLSRPSLSEQHTIPVDTLAHRVPGLREASQYSHAYPSHPLGDPFILTPLLTLPPAFGSVFIGETFSCCLSANNEAKLPVACVRITVQMQTPSQTLQLNLGDAGEGHRGGDSDENEGTNLAAGGSLQKIVNYDLKEEGSHVLAVMITYADQKPLTQESSSSPPESRVRTFKKLYQFVAQQCIMVRTKAGPLPGGKAILEAQLENLSESPVSLHKVSMKTVLKWKSLNWDMDRRMAFKTAPLLRSRDVMQVAFLLELDAGESKKVDSTVSENTEPLDTDANPDKGVIGQLNIEWKTSCGDRGFLRTGKLALPA